MMPAVALNTATKLMQGDIIHELSKNGTTSVHRPLLASQRPEKWPYTQQGGLFKSITAKRRPYLYPFNDLESVPKKTTGQPWVKPTFFEKK
jgi:hypothetical protein